MRIRLTPARVFATAAVLMALLAHVGAVHADVVVTVTPDTTTAPAGTPTGYTIHVDAPTPTIIRHARVLLPSHGQPCGRDDEAGDPVVGGDDDTNMLVTGSAPAGAITTGRWVTWPDPVTTPAKLRLDVILAPLGGCFYAGATGDADTPVIGLRRGASIFVDQAAELATGGTATPVDATAVVTWWMRNGTDHPVTITTERLGASKGFRLASSTLAGDAHRSQRGVSWTWHEAIVIPAGGEATRVVTLQTQCAAANLRLRITRDDGTRAGTGDGVPFAGC